MTMSVLGITPAPTTTWGQSTQHMTMSDKKGEIHTAESERKREREEKRSEEKRREQQTALMTREEIKENGEKQ